MIQKQLYSKFLTLLLLFCMYGIINGNPLARLVSISNITPQIASSYGDYVPPASGSWFINENTRVENLNAQLNGSIEIESNIAIEFVNCTFHFISDHHVKMLSNSNITLKGLNVTISNKSVIEIVNCKNITLENINARGFGGDHDYVGIHTYDTQNVSVFDSVFQNFAKGVYAGNITDFYFENNIFEQTSETESTDGELQVEAGSKRLTFYRNTIRNCALDGFEIRETSEINITQNIIIGGNVGLGITKNSSNAFVINNTFINSNCVLDSVDYVNVEKNNFENGWLSSNLVNNAIIRYNTLDYVENLTYFDATCTNFTQSDNYFRYVLPDPSDDESDHSPEDGIDGFNPIVFVGCMFVCGKLLIRKTKTYKND